MIIFYIKQFAFRKYSILAKLFLTSVLKSANESPLDDFDITYETPVLLESWISRLSYYNQMVCRIYRNAEKRSRLKRSECVVLGCYGVTYDTLQLRVS